MNQTTAPTLNHWQRRQMRAAALSFRHAHPFPSVIAAAITHRELSFTGRPMHEQRANTERDTARALKRAGIPSTL